MAILDVENSGMENGKDDMNEPLVEKDPESTPPCCEGGVAKQLKEFTKTRSFKLIMCLLPTVLMWIIPVPDSVVPPLNKKGGALNPQRGWYTLGVFLSVIVAFLSRPFPEGFSVVAGVAVMGLHLTLTDKTTDGSPTDTGSEDVLGGFANKAAWLVLVAMFIAGAIAKTGLGKRIALFILSALGGSYLGIAYGVCITELLLGPAVPSNIARGAGIIAPIVESICKQLGSTPTSNPVRNGGAFIILVANAANLLSSTMFLTASTSNSVIVGSAKANLGVTISWGDWFLSGLVPGATCMLLMPFLCMVLAKPDKFEADPRSDAKKQLAEMGPTSRAEWILMAVLFSIVGVWGSEGYVHSMDSVIVALVGLVVLVFTDVLSYQAIQKNTKAWNFLLWMGGLMSLSNTMTKYGVTNWMASLVADATSGLPEGNTQMVVLMLLYFLSMYLMSSLTAHAAAIGPVLLSMPMIKDKHQPMLSMVMHFTTLCAVTTHYGSGTAQHYYDLGYLPLVKWLGFGFLMAIFFFVVFFLIGPLWWCTMLGQCVASE